jgi:hypothetical protein
MPTKKTSKKNKVTKSPAKKPAKKAVKKTVAPPPVAPPVAPPAPQPAVVVQPPARSEADKIWAEIQNLPIQMFGLPEQFVFQHCTPIPVEPTSLYVTVRSSATLPSLEAAIAHAFVVELADKFVIIKRIPKPIIPSKKK